MLNIDSIVLDKDVQNNKKSLESEFGENVTLCNFDFVNDGFVNGKFVLDGKKDYIEIKTDWKDNTKGKFIENGMTLEFYGPVLDAGTAYDVLPPYNQLDNTIFPILSINTSNEWSPVRFWKNGKNFYFNFGSWKQSNPWNLPDYSQCNMYFVNMFSEEKLPYVTFTLNHLEDDSYETKLYLNGALRNTGLIRKEYMDDFWSRYAPRLGVIRIGEMGMSTTSGSGTCARLGKGEFDVLRLYSRCLDETEVQENYDIWKLYREN